MGRGMSRAERLREMERLYIQRAFSDIEMAERLGVDRTTVYKDRTALEAEVPFAQDENGRWRIDRARYLSEIRVNLHEALALYLAARRTSRQTRIAQPHVASALEKLAVALKQPMTERLVKSASSILAQSAQPERIALMETVTRGWVEQLKLRLVYQGLHAQQPWNFVVSPYLIEPALWSDGAYVIGHSDVHGDVAIFKIERIVQATLTSEPFAVPQDFDEARLLDYAWGIWPGEGEPVEVRLRFAPGDATRRVKESIWHPQQEPLVDTEDGGCIWTATVSEPREMIPWIRGWGADCEVVEPEWLKEELEQEARRLAIQYRVVTSSQNPAYRLLWAKANKSGFIHRLLYHMIDVGQVALALWQAAFPDSVKRQMSHVVGLSVDQAGPLFAFWASLHDLGKASPAFQDHPNFNGKSKTDILRDLEQAGLSCQRTDRQSNYRHELISTWALEKGLLAEETGLEEQFAKRIAQALGGHHGAWPHPFVLRPDQLPDEQIGLAIWQNARRELVRELKHIFQPPTVSAALTDSAESENAFLTQFSALVSVADWIGSDDDFFPLKRKVIDITDYAELSAARTEKALRALGWLAKPTLNGLVSFREAVERDEPRPLQDSALHVLKELTAPALVILEAPTGIGKTEIALYLADVWAQGGQANGLYVAMPTTATSNQMHSRTKKFLRHRYGDVQALLVHSRVLLGGKAQADEAEPVEEKDREGDRVNAMAWFLPRKRSLLAPFGIGTVDQALMSILQTKHFFTRLLGLSGKVVIFDEVHAYDAYMNTLFKRLLAWLRELNASVIVLSATLPESTRRELAAAYLGQEANDDFALPTADYPRLTFAPKGGAPQVASLRLPDDEDQPLGVQWLERDQATLIKTLRAELNRADSVCAAVICNRVDRAQEVFRVIEAEFYAEAEVTLFHARTPFIWRKEREDEVLGKFGPPDDKTVKRPRKAIVVATQVIEQSLDLDFDVMLTDHAPIDLLLQRAGRLHRHGRLRQGLPRRLFIVKPESNDNELPHFGKDKYVYAPYTLLATWFALHGKSEILLPKETSLLIEQVYGNAAIAALTADEQAAMADARKAMEKKIADDKREANARLVLSPDNGDYLTGSGQGLDEDNPELHAAFKALTRKDAPGVQVVCLHETLNGWMADPDDRTTQVDPYAKLTSKQIELLLTATMDMRRYDVKTALLQIAPPPLWKKFPALRYHRLLVFRHDGINDEVPTCQLRLTRELGLQFIPRKEAAPNPFDYDDE